MPQQFELGELTQEEKDKISLHAAKLTVIYKKLFGYFRTDDAEAKAEILQEAAILSKEIAYENYRFYKHITGNGVTDLLNGNQNTAGN